MRFGKTLKNTIYPPWKGHYIDYHKLKSLLREHETKDDSQGSDEGDTSVWTEQDEETFVQELINVQLDKVNSFQVETYKQLRDRTSECEAKLEPLALKDDTTKVEDDEERRRLSQDALNDLDHITKELSELEKFSRINFTGFLKAAKKHDRRRGARYRVRPLLQVRLGQLPFNSEDYSPLLYRLSIMYTFVRQNLGQSPAMQPRDGPAVDVHLGKDAYSSHKFWVHVDNLLEVKTYILRRLPVLVYNPNTSSKDFDVAQADPTITSLYFDGPKFELYNQKVERTSGAGSLRLRWTGQLKDKPEIFLEKKTMRDSDDSREIRIPLKEKQVQPFLNGDFNTDKITRRMERQSNNGIENRETLERDIEEIQSFIREHELNPVVRATYTRTAFQIPGDDRIRISLDTDLALIREDSLDGENPCRNPNDWHRSDIDSTGMEYPFSKIPSEEIRRFPHALLEIKMRGSGTRASREWLSDLMSSHLLKDAPRFSKFVHGVAELFEDQVNSFPFWLSELETDIRRDPETAFQEEREKMAKRAEDEFAVGSFLGNRQTPPPQPIIGSPITTVISNDTAGPSSEAPRARPQSPTKAPSSASPEQPDTTVTTPPQRSGFRSLLPKLSMSRYALAHRGPSNQLPPGVRPPGTWIKDSGPVRVEDKVWLANQRTFIKWQHICILLATLSLGLYNAAEDNAVARTLAIVYTGFALFAGAWGYWMYLTRLKLIRARSGQDLDNITGPLVLCVGLSVALVLNFWFKYVSAIRDPDDPSPPNPGPGLPPTGLLNDTLPIYGSGKLVNQA